MPFFAAIDHHRGRAQVSQLLGADGLATHTDPLQAVRRSDRKGTGSGGCCVLGNAVTTGFQTVMVINRYARCTIGTTIDGNGQVSGVAVQIAIGQRVGKDILQLVTILEGVDVRVAVIQRVAVEAIGANGQVPYWPSITRSPLG